MDLENRIAAIEARNEKVTLDKRWETSLTRRVSIGFITYICASAVFLFLLPNSEWYIGALVPVMGYILSTLGLPWIRRLWERKL